MGPEDRPTNAGIFSKNNTPFDRALVDIGDRDIASPPGPTRLVRQTNEWMAHFGNYPELSAEITNERAIFERLRGNGVVESRHIFSELISSPESRKRKTVVDYISRIIDQIHCLYNSGELTYSRLPSKTHIVFTTQEEIVIDHYVCDDSGAFRVLVSKPTRYCNGKLETPNFHSTEVISLIIVLRDILSHPDNFLHTTIYSSPYGFTTPADVVSFYVTPKFELPEWFHDNEAEPWNFPETEPFQSQGLLYLSDHLDHIMKHPDIEEKNSFMKFIAQHFPEETVLKRQVCDVEITDDNFGGFDTDPAEDAEKWFRETCARRQEIAKLTGVPYEPTVFDIAPELTEIPEYALRPVCETPPPPPCPLRREISADYFRPDSMEEGEIDETIDEDGFVPDEGLEPPAKRRRTN